MRQRTISDFFWRDPSISDLSQEDKATLLYFLTSPSSNIIGVYQIVWMIAAAEMGWTKDQLLVVAKRLKEKGLIEFNSDGWIWVKIWWKHNSPGVALNPNSKLISHAKKQCAVVPFEWLLAFGESLEAVGIKTLAIGYPYPQKAPSDAPSNPAFDTPLHAGLDAPSDAPYIAPSEKEKSLLKQGGDAPSDAPSDAALDAPYHGRRGNRYLVSSNTTTTNSTLENSELENTPIQTVVVGDVIFPPETNEFELSGILAVLASSGASQEIWQVIVDELTGARVHYTIRSPVGFVRELAQRALSGAFIPEYGIAVAKNRLAQEQYKKLQEAQKQAEKLAWTEHPVDIQAALANTSPNLRSKTEKLLAIVAQKSKVEHL
ncbi:MAG: hypothetical protein ACXWTX_04480 [Gallionella sp.]